MAPDAACPVITPASLELGNRVIDGFYNPSRRHSANGQLSPADFERRHAAETSGKVLCAAA